MLIMMRPQFERHRTWVIVALSILFGVLGAVVLTQWMPAVPFDYAIYMEGARMVRAGQDPYATLPFWYPLPIVLFTIVPWSCLPDLFWWAFALIPLGLLHLHFGKRTPLTWLFYPLLVNVAYAQAEGWLILPLVWLLRDVPIQSSLAMLAFLFKPAYVVLLAPYRLFEWVRARDERKLKWLVGLTVVTFGAAFVAQPAWLANWFAAIQRRGASPGLIERNITAMAFWQRGEAWWLPLGLLGAAWLLLTFAGWRYRETRGASLVAASLMTFPNGLYPVSVALVLPFVETTGEILVLVLVSWLIPTLEIFTGDFGGYYLSIVLVALALRVRRAQKAMP
jgi:hypothetical protein